MARLSRAWAAAVAWCHSWFATAATNRAIAATMRRYKQELKSKRLDVSDWEARNKEQQATIEWQSREINILKNELEMYASWEVKIRERLAAETAEYAARAVAAMGGRQLEAGE